MGPASHLAFFKSSIIGGLRANDEVGSAARERLQMKSVNGMWLHHHLQYQSSAVIS
jgi:hypothetical protein